MLGEDYLRDICHIDMAEDTRASNLPSWRVNPPKRAVYLLADFQNSGSIFYYFGFLKLIPIPIFHPPGKNIDMKEVHWEWTFEN